jgi:glycosyltransferase involved in cell wall biosynthesis
MKLSICICTIERRRAQFEMLRGHIVRQILADGATGDVEMLCECDRGRMSVGAKRQRLLERAQGEYVCWIDDDDWVDDYYVAILRSALNGHNVDCLGMAGWITTDDGDPHVWRISRTYPTDTTVDGVHLRRPNHLVPIRREHALAAGFPDISRGEDKEYANRLQQLGVLKSEYFIPKALYWYRFSTSGTATQQPENDPGGAA